MKVLLLIFLLLNFTFSYSQTINDITFYTEHFPPFNYDEYGELKGIAVDVLEEILIDIGSEITRNNFKLLPWSRVYNLILKEKNTCLFTMVRSKERELLFKWVGPIKSIPIVLIAKKSKNIKINNLNDISRYKTVVIRDDIGHNLLVNNGIQEKSLFITTFPNKIPLLLHNERVDIWVYGELSAFNIMDRSNIDKEEYEVIHTLTLTEKNYYAFNIETSDNIIHLFQNSLDKLKENGTYQKIIDSYLYKN